MYVQSRRYWRECRTLSGRRCLGYRPRNWDISQQINKMKTPMCGGSGGGWTDSSLNVIQQSVRMSTTDCDQERPRRDDDDDDDDRLKRVDEHQKLMKLIYFWQQFGSTSSITTPLQSGIFGENDRHQSTGELEGRKCPCRDEGENEK